MQLDDFRLNGCRLGKTLPFVLRESQQVRWWVYRTNPRKPQQGHQFTLRLGQPCNSIMPPMQGQAHASNHRALVVVHSKAMRIATEAPRSPPHSLLIYPLTVSTSTGLRRIPFRNSVLIASQVECSPTIPACH